MQWTAATDNVAVVGYEIRRGGTFIGQITSGLAYTDSGRAPLTAYTYSVRAFDAAGNRSSWSSALSVTTDVADVTAPSVPTGLLVTGATSTTVSLSWTAATDNVALAGYLVFRNGTQVGAPTATTFTDTGLLPGIIYSYTVKAQDQAGNQSAASAAVSSPDLVAPTIPTGLTITAATGTTASLSWLAAADNVAVTTYLVFRNGTQVGTPTTPAFNDSGLTAGTTYTYTVKAQDQAGNQSAASAAVVLESTPPSVPTGLALVAATGSTIALSWTAATDNVAVVGYVVFRNGTQVGTPTAPNFVDAGLTASTAYSYTVKAKDPSGNLSAASATFSASTTISALPPTNLTLSSRTDSTLVITWTAGTDPQGGAITGYDLLVGGTLNSTLGVVTTATLSGLTRETAYTITLKSINGAGTRTAASLPLTVKTLGDTVAPTVPGTPSLVSNTPTSVTLQWTASTDNIAVTGYDVLRSNTVVGQVTSGLTFTDTGLLPNANNYYQVRAYDAVGNRSTTSGYLYMSTLGDTVAPTTPTGLTVTGTTAASVSLSWTAATDNVGIQYYAVLRNGSQVGTPTGTTFTDTQNLSANTTYSYTVATRDLANNASPASSAVSATTAVDTAAPSKPGTPYASTIGFITVTLAWAPSTDNVAVTSYDVLRNGTLVGTATSAGYSDSGLATNTTYSYTVIARDAAGNASTVSSAGSVKTLAESVAPLPPTSVLLSSRTDSSLSINWAAGSDTGGSGVVSYDILVGGVLNSTIPATSYATINGLTQNTSYTITLKSVDGAGLRSAASLPLVVRTLVDATLPTAPGTPALVSNTATSVTMQWTASTDNVGVTGYDVMRSNVVVGQVTSGLTFTDSGLAPGSNNYYQIRAYDAAGNRSAASGYLYMATLGDSVLPSVPTGLTVTGTTVNSVALSWTAATDNVGVQSYVVLRNGSQVGTPTTTTFTDRQNLAAATTYSYTVYTRDLAGNNSAVSSAVSATTAVDSVAPSVPGTPYLPYPSYLTFTSVSFAWPPASDNVAVSAYDVYRNSVLIGTASSPSYSDSALVPGTAYSYTVKARDATGNTSASSAAWSVTTPGDGVAPQVPTTLYVSGRTTTSLQLYWSGASDPNGSGVTSYVVFANGTQVGNPASTSFNITGLALNTSYTLTVKAKDAAGNLSAASLPTVASTSLTDTTVPTTPGAPSLVSNTATSITLQWTGSTDNVAVAGYEVRRSAVTVARVTSGLSYTDTGLAPGASPYYQIVAYDAAGNLSSISSYTYLSTLGDSVLPTAPTGLTVTATTAGSVSLSWTAATDNTGIQYYLIYRNGYGYVSYNTPGTTFVDTTAIASSTAYTYTVYARDLANNTSPASTSVTGTTAADSVVPSKPGTPFATVAFTTASLTWGPSSDNVGVTSYDIYRNAVKIGSSASNTYYDSGLTAGTTYSYTVIARDSAANSSPTSSAASVTTPADTTAPDKPTSVILSSRTDASLTVSWTGSGDPGGSGVVSYDVLVGGVLNTNVAGGSVVISGLAPATAYTITVKAVDGGGNRSAASLPLIAKTGIDTTTPIAPGAPTAVSNTMTSVTMQWTAATDNVAVTGYEILRSSVMVAQVTSGTTFTDTGLVPGSNNYYYVRAYDAAGNRSPLSAYTYLPTLTDTVVPSTPTGLTVTGTTPASISLSWTASTDNAAMKEYLITRSGYGQVGIASGTTFTDTLNLNASTAYTYTVTARDLAGNVSAASSSATGTTTGDTAAPSVPGAPYVPYPYYLSFTSVTLYWSPATDNVRVSSYDIYRGGTLVGSSGSTSFSDSGLTAGTTYSYTVVARDAAGNASAASSAGSITTTNDTVAPLPPSGVILSSRGDTLLNIQWTPGSDPAGSGIVGYDIFVGGTLNTSVAATSYATITGLLPTTTYTITLKSIDGKGNRSVASMPLIARTSIDLTAPAVPAGLTLSGRTASSLTVQWASVTDNVAVAGYEIIRGSTAIAQITSGTTYTDGGLPPGSANYYYVRAYDAAGNRSGWSPYLYLSLASDGVPPSTPIGLIVTDATPTTLAIRWAASSDNVGVQSYAVLRNAVQVGTVATGTVFSDAGLTPNTAYSYTITAQDAAGNVSAASSALSASTTPLTVPTITTQPANSSVLAGVAATFSLVASGTGPLSYQWSRSNDGGTTWSALSGAVAASYTTPVTTITDNAAKFRCLVSNTAGSATSSVATLTVNRVAPTITKNPANQTVPTGTTVTFTMTASGIAPVTYQWSRSDDAGTIWRQIAGATGTSYSLTSVGSDNGALFRCAASNSGGRVFTSNAKLSLQAAANVGLASRWPFETTVGDSTPDVSGNANNGVLINAPTLVSGHTGVAIHLNGINQFVATSNQIVNPQQFSLALWFKTAQAGGQLMGFGNAPNTASGSHDRMLYIDTAGKLVFGIWTGSAQTVVSPAAVNNNAWHHVVATLSGAGMVLYLDGVQVGQNAAATTAQSYTGWWRLGYDNLGGWPNSGSKHFFLGDLDEALVYNRALAAAEATALFNGAPEFSTFAGFPDDPGSVDGVGLAARFNAPGAIALDTNGNAYVADTNNHTIRKITPSGAVTTLAGSAGLTGSANGTGAAARFNYPTGVAVDASGNVYVADQFNHTIRKVTAAGVVTTLAGTAETPGSSNGTGAAALFNYPTGIALDASGNLYVTDQFNCTIRKITPAAVVTTLAGSGSPGYADGTGLAAAFSFPTGIAMGPGTTLYVTDTMNHLVRTVSTSSGAVTTFAGTAGTAGSVDGTGTAAQFSYPNAVTVSSTGTIYVVDNGNCTIRALTPARVVTTLAGLAGVPGSSDGLVGGAGFNYPSGIAIDDDGNLYVVDTGNHTIRKGTPTPAIPGVPGAPG